MKAQGRGLPPTKLSTLHAAMDAGDWPRAFAIAAKFPRLGDHAAAIRRAHEACVRPDFLKQLGRDPEAAKLAGRAALLKRYPKGEE